MFPTCYVVLDISNTTTSAETLPCRALRALHLCVPLVASSSAVSASPLCPLVCRHTAFILLSASSPKVTMEMEPARRAGLREATMHAAFDLNIRRLVEAIDA